MEHGYFMNRQSIKEGANSAWRLFRFVFWYAVAVSGFIYVLPEAAVYVQQRYESLDSLVRLTTLTALFLLIAVWQVREIRARLQPQNPKDRLEQDSAS